jgi:hypothetical protein
MVVSTTLRPPYLRKKDLLSIAQEAGWVPYTVWTGAENLIFTGIRFHERIATDGATKKREKLSNVA